MSSGKGYREMTCGTFNGMTPFMGSGVYQPQPCQQILPAQHLLPSQQAMPMQQFTPSQQVTPALPTGFPSGGTTIPLLPSQNITAGLPLSEQLPATVQSTLYTPGFLKTQIGRRMRIEFLIGTGALIDRTGTLLSVGASYILIRLVDSDDIMMCDIYSIKFVTIFF